MKTTIDEPIMPTTNFTDDVWKKEICKLAQLSVPEYEQAREAAANSLKVRVSVLDKAVQDMRLANATSTSDEVVIPWDEPVNGAELLDSIAGTIRRFIVCEETTVRAATLWITFTWFIDYVNIAPIALITAPEMRCGKSQLLTLLGKMSKNPLLASNISPAAIFRAVEAYKPTLLIDEVDTFLRSNEEARGIINSGHQRGSAYVIRSVGDTHEPTRFSTWGAKALCGIGKLQETIMDRSIPLVLRRKLPKEKVERLRYAHEDDFLIIRRKLARYSDDYAAAISVARPMLPEELDDRAQDNWEPLLAIADQAGREWPKQSREAALMLSGNTSENMTITAELLNDIRQFLQDKASPHVSTSELLAYLNGDDLLPWSTCNKGNELTPRKLAEMLKGYEITPKNWRSGKQVMKGYDRIAFTDAFSRYLPASAPEEATPLHMKNNPTITDISLVADCSVNIPMHATANTLNLLDSSDLIVDWEKQDIDSLS